MVVVEEGEEEQEQEPQPQLQPQGSGVRACERGSDASNDQRDKKSDHADQPLRMRTTKKISKHIRTAPHRMQG